MNKLFNNTLGQLITLKEKKVLKKENKKIVSTCIFLPENPSLSIKTPVYILGLIKTIETFKEEMGNDWILRVYYDSLFDKGITKKDIERTIESSEDTIQETSIPNKSIYTTNKKNKKKSLSVSDSSYEYFYNKIKSVKSPNKQIKENIIKNRDSLKKLIKLLKLYFDEILNDRTDRYNNIELISYDCQEASKHPEFIGHPSTFGSIMRFLPLYDENVDSFFCINSRYSITPLQRKIINDWQNDLDLTLLTIKYNNKAVGNCIIENLNEKGFQIFEKYFDKKGYRYNEQFDSEQEINNNDKLFIDFLNNIYDFKFDIFNVSYKKQKKINKFESRHNKLTLSDISSSTGGYEYESIAAGFFGYKNDNYYHIEKCELFSQLLTYYIKSKNKFQFGIDELFLKVILAFEVGTSEAEYKDGNLELYFNRYKLNPINNYIKFIKYHFNNTDIKIISKDKKYIKLNDFITNGYYHYVDRFFGKSRANIKELIYSNDYQDIQIFNSRSLYIKDNGDKINSNDKIYKLVSINKKNEIVVSFNELFSSFDEEKRLFIVDTSNKNRLDLLFNKEACLKFKDKNGKVKEEKMKIGKYFTTTDLAYYKQSEIKLLLEEILEYFKQKKNHNIIKFVSNKNNIGSLELKKLSINSNNSFELPKKYKKPKKETKKYYGTQGQFNILRNNSVEIAETKKKRREKKTKRKKHRKRY